MYGLYLFYFFMLESKNENENENKKKYLYHKSQDLIHMQHQKLFCYRLPYLLSIPNL